MLNSYGLNKLISIGLPLSFLLSVMFLYSIDNPQSWWILIVAAHTLGYTHFILGYIYQSRSVARTNRRNIQFFLVLTSIGLSISIAAAVFDQMSLLAIFAIGYFIFHGVMNESTLMFKQFGYTPGLKFMLPIGLYILPFFLLSLPHPSFFFTPQLFFLNPTPTVAMDWLGSVVNFDILQMVSFGCLAVFLLTVPTQLILKGKYIEAMVIVSTVLITARLFIDQYPLNYIVLYFLFLSYHFISWSMYFYQTFRLRSPERIPAYVRDHLLVLVPLILLSVGSLLSESVSGIHHIAFNGGIFITFAMIHNTTSILNEEWFIKFFNLSKNAKKQ